MVTLTIPGELTSLNEYISALNRNRFVGAKIKKEETERVFWHCREQKLSLIGRPVTISFHWYMKNKKKDLDNVAFAKKFILDGLVEAGILFNDTQEWVKGFEDRFSIDNTDPRVEVHFAY